jgi:hypothetical protein
MIDQDLTRLFRETDTTSRDPAFVTRVVAKAARYRRAPGALSGIAVELLKAAGLAAVAVAGGFALDAAAQPLLAVLADPVVSNSLVAVGVAIALAVYVARRSPA